MLELVFILEEDEDNWPPFASEGIYCLREGAYFRVDDPPLFIEKMSVGDLIEVVVNADNFVESWKLVETSARSVVWIMGFGDYDLEPFMARMRDAGCNTKSLRSFNCFTVDVPENLTFDIVDAVLDAIDKEQAAIAFPSFRHPDD